MKERIAGHKGDIGTTSVSSNDQIAAVTGETSKTSICQPEEAGPPKRSQQFNSICCSITSKLTDLHNSIRNNATEMLTVHY